MCKPQDDEAREHRGEVEAAVDMLAELSEVARQTLRADGACTAPTPPSRSASSVGLLTTRYTTG